MSYACQELFGGTNGIGNVPMAGRTDCWIVRQIAAARGVPSDGQTVERFRATYLSRLAIEITEPHPQKSVMPGVHALLETLAARDDAYLALLTGNFEEGARAKLEYFGLWRYFKCGAFGDDIVDRNALLPVALARVAACCGPVVDPASVVVVGDTPLDVAVAISGGARSVAVATGGYDVDALWASGADVVMPDLSDLPAALQALGF